MLEVTLAFIHVYICKMAENKPTVALSLTSILRMNLEGLIQTLMEVKRTLFLAKIVSKVNQKISLGLL